MSFDLSDLVKTTLAGLIGGAVTLAGSTLDYFNKDRELDIRMVDVALTILSAKDENTKSQHAKMYALSLLSQYGGVEIKDADKLAWAKEGELPFGRWPSVKYMEGWNSAAVATGYGYITADMMKEGSPFSQEIEKAIRAILQEELDKKFSGPGIVNPEQQ